MRRILLAGAASTALALALAATAAAHPAHPVRRWVVVQSTATYRVECLPTGRNRFGRIYGDCRKQVQAAPSPSAHAAVANYWAWYDIPTDIAWANAGSGYKYYAQWECDLAGSFVAAGITYVGMSPPSAVAGILAGGFVTAGCEIIWPDIHSEFTVGVPWSTYTLCWMVFPKGQSDIADHEEECAV